MNNISIIDLMIRNNSHAMIIGTSGVGKTTLIKEALCKTKTTDYNIVVFDTIGTFQEQTMVHGPIPINIFDFCRDPIRILDCINETLLTKFGNVKYCLSPAMEEIFLEMYERAQQEHSKLNFRELVKILKEEEQNTITRERKLAIQALTRRLRYFNIWMLNETHPVIRKVFSRMIRGLSLGIDLSFLSDVQRFAYVLMFLLALSESRARNIIVVIDEAHLLLREETTLLGEQVRVGRNFNRLFLLVTHSPDDIPPAIRNIVRIVVRFPLSIDDKSEYLIENPHAAVVKMLVTDSEIYRAYGKKVVTFVISPNVKELSCINIVNLKKCLSVAIKDVVDRDVKRRRELLSKCLEYIRWNGFCSEDKTMLQILQKAWKCLDYG